MWVAISFIDRGCLFGVFLLLVELPARADEPQLPGAQTGLRRRQSLAVRAAPVGVNRPLPRGGGSQHLVDRSSVLRGPFETI